MFGPEAPPLEWDARKEYTRQSIELYYLSHAGEGTCALAYKQLRCVSICAEPKDQLGNWSRQVVGSERGLGTTRWEAPHFFGCEREAEA